MKLQILSMNIACKEIDQSDRLIWRTGPGTIHYSKKNSIDKLLGEITRFK